MSVSSDPETRTRASRRLPVKTWLFAALLFAVGVKMLTAGDR
jgi:hypothetical protein